MLRSIAAWGGGGGVARRLLSRFPPQARSASASAGHGHGSEDGHGHGHVEEGGGFFSAGTQEQPNGYLFNETPPPPGQSRKWEDWELPCYIAHTLAILMLTIGLSAKPDTNIETWARKKALERMAAEGDEEAVAERLALAKAR